MESNSKKIILSYREGCSGSWLAELISCCQHNTEYHVNFRQDINGVPPTVYHFNDHLATHTRYNAQQIVTCHSDSIEFLTQKWPGFEIYRIIPSTFVLDAIASSWYKIPPKNVSTVDDALEYIKKYYELHTKTDLRFGTVVDYGKLRDTAWIQEFIESNNIQYNKKYDDFVENYWALQKKTNFETIPDGLTMTEVLNTLSLHDDVFGIAMAIFVYEKSNLLSEHQRRWSVDILTTESNLLTLAYTE